MAGVHFTERARHVLERAAAEATALDHEYVGTEHILLALLADDGGVAEALLAALRVDRARVRESVLQAVRPGKSAPPAAHPLPSLPYTSRSKTALELAATEARGLHHDHVGPEHILLGLLAEGKGIAAQVLFDAGATLAAARAETIRVLGEPRRDDRSEPRIGSPRAAATMPVAPRDVNETQAWLRLRSALEITRLLGGTPTLRREADGTLVASLGDALEITIALPPEVTVRERRDAAAPAPDA
jgi:ATP-dependent Clp protease ATP-binding subunit ClpC